MRTPDRPVIFTAQVVNCVLAGISAPHFANYVWLYLILTQALVIAWAKKAAVEEDDRALIRGAAILFGIGYCVIATCGSGIWHASPNWYSINVLLIAPLVANLTLHAFVGDIRVTDESFPVDND
ncbi:MAG: hypothetical protein ACYTGL_19460 [Planctomycetota bacterium]|jgi:hypothetical protein